MENRKYFGCKILQRVGAEVTPMFVFFGRARDVHQWAGIRRQEAPVEINQRILRETRSRAVSKFFQKASTNIIPSSILLAFDHGVTKFTSAELLISDLSDTHNFCGDRVEWGTLEFEFDPTHPDSEKPAQVVDGQHRLEGMSTFINEDMPVILVGLLDASRLEQAFQFIVINRKAVGVPTDNVKSIIADFKDAAEEAELSRRLLDVNIKYGNISPILRELNDSDASPFYMLLDWDYNRGASKLIPPTALEISLRHLRSVFPFLDEDEDSLVQVYMCMWRGVRESYPTLWGRNNKLANKVCMLALNSFLCSHVNHAWISNFIDIFRTEDVQKQTKNIVSSVPKEFWEVDWVIKLQDNQFVRDTIQGDLETVLQNARLKRTPFKGLTLIQQEE